MRTPGQVTKLKQNWLGDPCWDIETTPGFEEYSEELKAFRYMMESAWKSQRAEELRQKADIIGCPGNYILAAYVERLEQRLDKAERRIETLAGNTSTSFWRDER